MLSFIENKTPDFERVSKILGPAAKQNHWANKGPVYAELAQAFASHMNIQSCTEIVPCANGGMALEAMARLHEQKAGRKLRWLVSSFSFQNLGRGYFSDVIFVDCDKTGMLSVQEMNNANPDSFDGLIVVNPFGMATDFSAYIEFSQASGKVLLIDNAAGISNDIPNWPWQSYSLHHTKPYGLGEGGLALVPSDEAAALYALLDYGTVPTQPSLWLNNGKISDISCAFHLSRLETVDDWAPLYLEQEERVIEIASQLGLIPLLTQENATPKTSCAFLNIEAIDIAKLDDAESLKFAKYYKPLWPCPNTQQIFDNLLNIPTHPDVSRLSDSALRHDIEKILLR